jgi:hypothetical protein
LVVKIQNLLKDLSGLPPRPFLPARRSRTPLPPQATVAPAQHRRQQPRTSYRDAVLTRPRQPLPPPVRQYIPLPRQSRPAVSLPQGPPPIPYHSRPRPAPPSPPTPTLDHLSRQQLIDLLRRQTPLAVGAPRSRAFRESRRRAFRGPSTATAEVTVRAYRDTYVPNQATARAYCDTYVPTRLHPSQRSLPPQNHVFATIHPTRPRGLKRQRRR